MKFGGPEMYRVANKAFTAGLPGKRIENKVEVHVDALWLVASLCWLSD